jgi:hypothetical protein
MCTDKLVTEENRKYTNNADTFALLPPVRIIIKVARKYFYLRDDTTYKACSDLFYKLAFEHF